MPWTSCPVCNRLEIKSLVQIVLSQIADIVSLIARYTVMGSMYEGSLVDLCVHILRYLNHVITTTTLESAEGAEQRLNESMKRLYA